MAFSLRERAAFGPAESLLLRSGWQALRDALLPESAQVLDNPGSRRTAAECRTVRLLVSQKGVAINDVDGDGYTPLPPQ